jgi:hypothetical protein
MTVTVMSSGVEVIERGRWYVDVALNGHRYRINCWLVWLTGSKTDKGTFWQLSNSTGLSLTQRDEIARELSTGGEWVGPEYRHRFDLPVTGTGSSHDGTKYRWASFGGFKVIHYPDAGGSQGYVHHPTHGWLVDVNDEMPHDTWIMLLRAVDAPVL